ncbi:MAG: hypothetical protein ABJF04_18310 [Reichenbachiella sp.]|uniref:hypothetical protein n=1 Tax=Reichenbachiella sp. TaxID=2184521 RepID=UPI003263C98F
MKTILAILLFIGATAFSAVAHNAKIATFTLRDTGAGWMIEMNFAQAGVDAAMIEEHGKQNLEGLSQRVYQDLVVDYVKSNFNLIVDGKRINLETGGIMMGSHQTDLKFVLPNLPLQPTKAFVYIPMFGTTYNQTNLFRIYRGGKNITKFFLSEDNDFKVDLTFTPDGVLAVEKETQDNKILMLGSGGIMLGTLLAIMLISRKKLGS